MHPLPTGAVTFLFTDIEGSTRLWELHPAEMPALLARHDGLLRAAIEGRGGHVFKTVGDAFCAVFSLAHDAVMAATDGQCALQAAFAEEGPQLRARMALHTGVADERDRDYFGRPVNRVARLLAIAHGGQVLLSGATHAAISGTPPSPLTLLDLGQHRLQDLQEAEWVHQLLHPDLPREFPPLRSLQRFHHNLPSQVTSFIGREKQMAEVEQLLSSARLLTLLGPGGIGKTRLAQQAAANLIERYPDGVWLVEMAALTEPSLVAQTAAASLNVQEEAGRPILETLSGALRAKKLLLILDNCEHLIDASARLAESLLRACPEVRILATSREPLQIPGEFVYRVPTLEMPEPKGSMSARDIAECGAGRLFQERAAAVATQFEITAENAEAVAQICRRVDGIPLAIELAAARARSLPVQEIARRLDDRFRLLTGGSRTALPRQQTLKALIDWSWDLLTEPEQVMLRRLAVFSGGCPLPAAEEVCADDTGVIDAYDVLDLVTQLVDKSLVNVEERAGGPRYRLMETIREYGVGRLREAGEEDPVRRRHFDWTLKLAQEAQPHFDGPGMQEWLDRLELEHDNLRAGLGFAPSGEDRLQLAIEIHRFWFVRGYLTEGREWLEGAIRDGAGADPMRRAKALNVVGVLAWRQGNLSAARGFIEASLDLRLECGDKSGAAAALNNLGLVADDDGDPASGRTYYEDAARIYRELGDRQRIGMVLANLGSNLIEQAEYAGAIAASEEYLSIDGNTRDPWCTAAALQNLAEIALRTGDTPRADMLARQALKLMAELDDEAQITELLTRFGEIALEQGFAERGVTLLAASEAFRSGEGQHLRRQEREFCERAKATARTLLTDAVFAHCWERGSALTISDAVRLVLDGDTGGH